MEYTVFITQSIYPLFGGKTLASNGYCRAFSKYTNLKVFSLYQSSKVPISKAVDECGIKNVTFYETSARKRKNKSPFELFSQIKGKVTGTVPIYREFYQNIVDFLNCNQINKVIVDHLGMCQYYFALRKKFPGMSFVYNSHNVEFINTKEEIENKRLISHALAILKYKLRYNYEKRMVKESQYVFCISKSDLKIIQQEFSAPPEKLIFSKPFIKFNKVKEKSELQHTNNKIMIVGSMNWYPNVEGTIWFIENVFLDLIKKNSRYKLYIVGNKPPEVLKDFEKKYPNNIEVTGFVESTEIYYKMCDISIIPVFRGTGAKIKVLESICRGIPTVCSDFAAKDYDISDEIMVATSSEDFYNKIVLIDSSSEVRMHLYERMMNYIANYYVLSEDVYGALR